MIFDHQLKVCNSDLMSWLSEEFFPCTSCYLDDRFMHKNENLRYNYELLCMPQNRSRLRWPIL